MTARGGAAHKQDHAKEANSGEFLPPSPPAEKATARQNQAGKPIHHIAICHCSNVISVAP
jgi:hypothetical protein